MKVSTKFKKYSNIVGTILNQIPASAAYIQGNVVSYEISYLHSIGKYTESDIGSEVWVTGMFYIGFLSTAITSYLEKKIGMRCTIFVGALFMSVGYFTTFFSVQHSMWLVALTFGLLPGIGAAQCINEIVSNIVKWMPGRMGLGVSIVTIGNGVGVLILNNIIIQYVNPNDVQTNKSINSIPVFTDKGVIERTPNLFLLLGFMAIFFQIVSIFLVWPVPIPDEEEQIILEKPDPESPQKANSNCFDSFSASNMTLWEALRQPSAYLLMASASFQLGAAIVMFATYKSFGGQFIKDDLTLTNIGGVTGLMVPLSRPVFGLLADKISHKFAIISMCMVLVVLFGTFYYTQYMGVVGFTFWLIPMMVLLGGLLPLFRSIIPRCYGVENQLKNQTIISIGYCIIAVITSLAMPTILSKLGWQYLFPGLAVLPLLSIVALIGFNVRLKDGSRV